MKIKIPFKNIRSPHFLNEAPEYGNSFSRGIKFTVSDTIFLYISGTASVDKFGKTYAPGNFKQQIRKLYANLTGLLKSENADWHDVVMTRCYLKDMKYYGEFNKYRTSYYKKLKLNPFPASVGIQAELCRKDLLIEIELTAAYKLKR